MYKSSVGGNFKTETERKYKNDIWNKFWDEVVKYMFKPILTGMSDIEFERALQPLFV